MVVLDPDGRVIPIHLLFSVRFNVYSNQQRILACLGNMPAKGLPPVVEIPDKAFAARRSVRAVLQFDHVTRLEGISLLDW